MTRFKAMTRTRYLFAFLFICVAVGFVSSSGLRASASKKRINFSVKSLVPNLAIVNLQVHKNHVLLSLRNDYEKAITAFSLSSSGVITRNEMLDSEQVIAPGSTNIGEYELPSASGPESGITILAAVFEDGSAVGGDRFIQQILDARAGNYAQLARILPILDETYSALKKAYLKGEWQTISHRVSRLPECEKNRSFEFCAAFNDEKELALRKISQLEQARIEKGDEVVEQMMTHIKERYERRNIMLQRSLKQLQ
jgi:hypothetical protein